MQTYFLGDLHGNNYALETCLQYLDRIQPDRIYCLGDLVGWLPFGNRTLRRMRELDVPTVAGNHDLLVAGMLIDHPDQVDRMQASAYNSGLLATEPETLAYLSSLPLSLEVEDFIVVHHSPFHLPLDNHPPTIDCFNYLDDKSLAECLESWRSYPKRLIISGHDHLPAVYELPATVDQPTLRDVVVHRPAAEQDLVVEMKSNAKYWVKAGSVGGPYRDRIPLANLVGYDDSQQTLALKRFSYPTGALFAELSVHHYFRNVPTLQNYLNLLESYIDGNCRPGG